MPRIDDAHFELTIAAQDSTDGNRKVIAELVAGEVSHQRAALEARVEVALQTSILAELMTVASQDSISPLREAFLSSRHRLTVAFELLPAEPGVVEAIATATQLEDLALAPQGVFA